MQRHETGHRKWDRDGRRGQRIGWQGLGDEERRMGDRGQITLGRLQRTGDKEQRREIGVREREARNRDVRLETMEGRQDKDVRQGHKTLEREVRRGQRHGWQRELTKNSENACGAPKRFSRMLSQRVTNFRACSSNEIPIFAYVQPTSYQVLRMLIIRGNNKPFKNHHSK